MSQRWTLESINWDAFDDALVDPGLLSIAKTASLVEANSADYVTYLHNVFSGDQEFQEAATQWGIEERLHGEALGKWAELADPNFNFERALALFRQGYSIPLDAEQSIRGSRSGELIARQVVESGTSSFYSAIRDACKEPVLKDIAKRIATDEFFHYQLFHKHFARYRDQEPLSRLAKLKIAISRVQEAEDDEIGYAHFAANILINDPAAVYDSARSAETYWAHSMQVYQEKHIDNATRMILRAAEFKPNGLFGDLAAKAFWKMVEFRRNRMEKKVPA